MCCWLVVLVVVVPLEGNVRKEESTLGMLNAPGVVACAEDSQSQTLWVETYT